MANHRRCTFDGDHPYLCPFISTASNHRNACALVGLRRGAGGRLALRVRASMADLTRDFPKHRNREVIAVAARRDRFRIC
jgi:hypothetical protein